MKNIAMTALVVLALVSCKNDKKEMPIQENAETTDVLVSDTTNASAIKKISVQLDARSASTARGMAYLSEKDGSVVFEAKITGLDPGMHAIHLHEKADCSSVDGKSSGGHWNPTFQAHGKWGTAEGYHKGDIGNFEVNANGIGSIRMRTDEWCIGCGDEEKDIVGKAIVVHQGEDDFKSQPSGAAGSRVSCGGIIK
ncbi:MAG: Cu-Zn family superoxide dismutase [Planctomycetota bacterium]|jgi:Cu-Zn family superoxide dismutase|uniref:superoxide dismutase family protein n=1 Tax=Patiriisocius sp. Uisw_047 TaxID=3230969 RepID=UPI0039ED1602